MRHSRISAAAEEATEVDLTPMLDVVFIMLIFFIVTANFIKEPGVDVQRPDAQTAEVQENAAILVAINNNDEIWIDGRRVDVRQVKANIVKLLADNPRGALVVRADREATAKRIVAVLDSAKLAGVTDVSLAAEN